MSNQDDKFARLSRRSTGTQTEQVAADVIVRSEAGNGIPSITEALESAIDGQVIRLASGTYRTERSLRISRSITIVGDGKSSTRIISTAPGDCFKVSGQVCCSISGISFEHEGDTVGNVFTVDAEKVNFTNCRFTGASRMSEDSDDGNGISVIGITNATCEECEAVNNAGSGFAFSADSRATVISCVASGNAAGIVAADRCVANFRNNRAIGNENGIGFVGNASGDANGNECVDNKQGGVNICENASPSLTNNVLKRNRAGMIFGQQASGTVIKNICSDNELSGIDVKDQSHPVLNENRCENNGNRGIAIADNAYGSIRNNICNNNTTFGIIVGDEAHPIVEGNSCSNNGDIGIGYKGSATGICRGNKCDNHQANIHVVENAKPQIQDEGGTPISASVASGSQSSDCFVVTATYGTPFAPEVVRFRSYRDRVLLSHRVGRLFVRFYYIVGPKLASIIRNVPLLRRASAILLGRIARHLEI